MFRNSDCDAPDTVYVTQPLTVDAALVVYNRTALD